MERERAFDVNCQSRAEFISADLEFLLQLPVDVDGGLGALLDGADPAPVDADLREDGREPQVRLVTGAQRDLIYNIN